MNPNFSIALSTAVESPFQFGSQGSEGAGTSASAARPSLMSRNPSLRCRPNRLVDATGDESRERALLLGPNQRFRGAVRRILADPALRTRFGIREIGADANRREQEQRTASLARMQDMFNADELKLPRAFEGKVTRGPDGKLASTDTAVAAILRYVEAKDPEAVRHLRIDPGCTLGLPLEPGVLLKAKEFAHGCAVRELKLAGEDSPLAVEIDMTTYATREAIKKGARGFQDGAQLTHADGAPGSPLRSEGQHPFKFLQEVRFKAGSNSPALADLVERCLNDGAPATLELRGRLGALAVKSVFSQKEVTKETWVALGLSMALSGGVAAALDILAWGAVNQQLSHQFGEDDARTRFAAIMLASVTPAIAETMDSFIVGRLIEKLRGGSFQPESLSDAWDTLKNALKSGGIASVGSIGNNALELTRKWAFQPLNFAMNQIAVATSGAMVPLEVDKTHQHMTAGVIQHMNNGFFPVPEVPGAAAMTEPQQHKSLARAVGSATRPALEVAPGDGLAINSMGIGALVSQLAFLPIDALARVGRLGEVVKSIVAIVTNTPTEVISTTIGSVTGPRLGGLGKAMTTDAEKDRLVMALIADKAIQRLNAPDANHPDASVEITEAELRAIEHPGMELTFMAGKLITGTMNGAVNLVSSVVGALRGKPPQTLGEKVDIAQLRSQMGSALPASH